MSLKNEIPRPNLDIALNQAIRDLQSLEAIVDTSDDLIRRIGTLKRFIAERSQNPVIPHEHRKKYYRKKNLIPVGYAHPGPNFNFPLRRG